MRKAVIFGAALLAASPAVGDWFDDFEGGLSQPFAFGNFTVAGQPSPTFQAGAIDGVLQFFDLDPIEPGPIEPNFDVARVGFGVVPTEVFTDVRVSGVLNPNGLPGLINAIGEPFPIFGSINDDLALLARANPAVGTSYTLAVSFNPVDPTLVITRSDGFSADDTTIAGTPLTPEQFSFTDSVFLEFELIGANLTGRLFDEQGGSLIAEVTASDATYAAGVSGVAVERDDVFNSMLGEFDNLSSVAINDRGGDGAPGDYNEDGAVDAVDYAVWRENLGSAAGTLANDPVGGEIGAGQLAAWAENFGATAPTSPIQQTPEPSTACLAVLCLLAGGHAARIPFAS